MPGESRISSGGHVGPNAPGATGSALDEFLERPPPRVPLAELPSPVRHVSLSGANGADFYVKCDERTSSLYGGGKVRKLEFELGRVGEKPAVSVGAVGSHHLLALAIFAAKLGRPVHAWTFPQEPTPHVARNLAALASLQPDIWHVPGRPALAVAALDYHLVRRPKQRGVWVPAGGSSPEGMCGFVLAALELRAQVDAGLLPPPATVYVTAGTAGTAAGLAVGFAAAGLPVHLHLVAAVEPWLLNRWIVAHKIRSLAAFLRRCGPRGRLANLLAGPVLPALARVGVTWCVDHGSVGAGYGRATEDARRAVAVAGDHGIVAETTYTGKCLAALLADLRGRQGTRRPKRPVLYWHTHADTDVRGFVRRDWCDRLPPSLRRWAERKGLGDLLS